MDFDAGGPVHRGIHSFHRHGVAASKVSPPLDSADEETAASETALFVSRCHRSGCRFSPPFPSSGTDLAPANDIQQIICFLTISFFPKSEATVAEWLSQKWRPSKASACYVDGLRAWHQQSQLMYRAIVWIRGSRHARESSNLSGCVLAPCALCKVKTRRLRYKSGPYNRPTNGAANLDFSPSQSFCAPAPHWQAQCWTWELTGRRLR